MKKLQKSFKNQHKELMDDEPQTSTTHNEHDESTMEVDGKPTNNPTSDIPLEIDDESETGVLPDNNGFPVCLGANRSVARLRAMRRVSFKKCCKLN